MIDPVWADRLLDTAVAAARCAGEIVRRDASHPSNVRRKGPRDLVTDTDHAAQTAALALIRAHYPDHAVLAEEDPGQRKPGPGQAWQIPPGMVWLVDPLDGTSNFAARVPFVCVSVGVALDGEPVAGAVYDPLSDELFASRWGLGCVTLNGQPLPPLTYIPLAEAMAGMDWAHAPGERAVMARVGLALSARCRTLRALGSAALAQAYVAAGRLQLYCNLGLQPWDAAAAAVLIREAGGDLRTNTGAAWRLGLPWLVAGHPALLDEALPWLQSLD